ncbi:MAG: DUF3619 family protein [Ramlibacter sp.]|nr:DUF3619 family protein [Ramlibacter sp.]MBX3660148.1 DUF3619 family protein [Ramlibacter sp.]MCW5648409.1 DUF3619 family protein [Ramlibacter sp.]
MTNSLQHQAQLQQDRLGLRLAAHLSDGADDLPYEIAERLRASRMQALARRKVLKVRPARSVSMSGGAATLTFDGDGPGWWGRLAATLPLVMLAAGLVAINVIQNESRAQEVAEVDAALLIDDLPPAAYADPGFMQFLKSGGEREQ